MTEYRFYVVPHPQDRNLVVAVDFSVKHEWPGGVMTQLYTTYEAIGCRHGADRHQIGPMSVAPFELDPHHEVDEDMARAIHSELFSYLDDLSEPDAKPRGRPRGTSRKKKDFRLPVSLLAALKAVADEEQVSDTEIIVKLLSGDSRIQQKLEKGVNNERIL